MQFIISFIFLSHISFASDLTHSSNGITVVVKDDSKGQPFVSITDPARRDYKYLVDRINTKIQQTTLNCAKVIVKCSFIGFQPESVLVVKSVEAFPDIKNKNSEENRKIIVVKGRTDRCDKYYWAWLPETEDEFKKGANLCKGLTHDCAWEIEPSMQTNGKFGWGRLNTGIFNTAAGEASRPTHRATK